MRFKRFKENTFIDLDLVSLKYKCRYRSDLDRLEI